MKVSPATIESKSGPKNSEEEKALILRARDALGVIMLTLNRPQAFNALSEAMLGELQRELDAIAAGESGVRRLAAGAGFLRGSRRKRCGLILPENYERLFIQCSEMMLSMRRLGGAGDCTR